MKGLEIAHGFWLEWGQPFLRQEFPHLSERVAAGRFLGSDVLGGDDAISRDHNWGPQFCLWLSEADYQAHGAKISETMNASGPHPWRGIPARRRGRQERSRRERSAVVPASHWHLAPA